MLILFDSIYRLDALDAKAYEAFQASHNLSDVIDRVMKLKERDSNAPVNLDVAAVLMTPVKPMLVRSNNI